MYESEIGRYVAYDSITIDKAVFIVTNLEKHTSYRDEIKSSVELKEHSNFVADFKPDRNWTAKLYLPEEIEVTTSGLFSFFSDKLQN